MFKSLLSAFLMYSRIPVPQVDWNKNNRRFAIGWFPIIGAVIGGILIIWRQLCTYFAVNQTLFAAVSSAIPILITGGIHMDGFCDVNDARASFSDKSKRLNIMSDPHIGSFAVIHACIYLILQTGLFSQLSDHQSILIIACGYVISRTFSGLSAVTFRCAKKDGTLQDFVKPSHKIITKIMLFGFMIMAGILMLLTNWFCSIIIIISAGLCFYNYKYIAYKEFDGITGDLCGWFLQRCELMILISYVVVKCLTGE